MSAAGVGVRSAASWVDRLARAGYAAKAVVYVIVGVLAMRLASGSSGRTTDSSGAMRSILSQPQGRALLLLVAMGLFGYALWRLVEAYADPQKRGFSPKGIAMRASYVVRGLAHGVLALQATHLVMGDSSRGGQRPDYWTGRLMDAPFGRVFVGLLGATVIGFAAYQLYRAAVARRGDDLHLDDLPPQSEGWAVPISRFGIAARGVVFGIIGIFLVRAALQHDASEAAGIGESLRAILSRPHGSVMLGIVGAGLIAYGVYQAIHARYGRIATV
jgi:hypothetical protein